MKFEITEHDRDNQEVLAYIDLDGDLRIKIEGENNVIGIHAYSGDVHLGWSWEPQNARQKFYKGDKITLVL